MGLLENKHIIITGAGSGIGRPWPHLYPLAALAVLLTLSLAGCDQEPGRGESQRRQTSTSAQSMDPPQGEHLLAEPPPGWIQGFFTETPTMRMVEYLPEDPGDNDWIEKVSFESFTAKELPDPIEFVTGIAADQADACENFEHFNILSAQENGYATSVRFMVCPENSLIGMGQITLIKAIQGNDRFYVITRAKRVPIATEGESAKPISDAEMAIWSTYMRAISVCDAELGEVHPCPKMSSSSSSSDIATH